MSTATSKIYAIRICRIAPADSTNPKSENKMQVTYHARTLEDFNKISNSQIVFTDPVIVTVDGNPEDVEKLVIHLKEKYKLT